MKKFLLLGLAIFFASMAGAATMQGSFYEWSTFGILENVILDLNTVPEQVIVAENGHYDFELNPGHYRMRAYYFEGEELKYYAEEVIKIQGEGIFFFDFLMTPLLEEDIELLELPPMLHDLDEELLNKAKQTEQEQGSIYWVLGGLVLALVLLFFLVHGKKRKEKKASAGKETGKTMENQEELDSYAKEVIQALKKSGNRLTQKELRDRVSVGEAKVSLIVSELEKEGLVKKIKQGRGNIIVLKQGKGERF